MKIIKRIVIGIILLVVILSAGTYLYLKTTGPVYSGEIQIVGLKEQVEVLYDDYGVPHIKASNAEDAYYALGYVHAQDRLFQMEMLRRAAAGRLSEILGPEVLKIDKLFRTLGLNEFARKHAAKFLSADTSAYQKAAHAYTRGINAYIKDGKTPIEYSIIGIPKQDFTNEDIYLAIGFMSFGFAEGLRADPVLQQIKSEWGEAYLADLAINTPPDAVRIKSHDGLIKPAANQKLISGIGEALEQLPIPMWKGSNGWVISGEHTASGFPILANDTHIGFSQPAVWYEAQIEYPGTNFYGHHIAGIPFALLGNNLRTGWGLTMFENDDADFFVEKVNPENPNQVKYKEGWENISIRKEIISIKGQPDVSLDVRSSRHGNFVNGILDNTNGDQPVALSWTLTQVTNEALSGIYELNHARGLADAQHAASLFSAPGLNIMYGDADGNIAWWAVAKLPIRPTHVQSKLFLDGASGDDEYLGYYEFSKNPHAINPPEGFVYSANNQPDSVAGVLYPGYYYPRSRAGRIVALISQDKKWTMEEVSKVHLDVVSITAPAMAKEIASVLKINPAPGHHELITLLEVWNGDHLASDIAPSVFYNMLSQIMSLSMKDELGESAYKSIMMTSVPKNSYLTFLSNDASPWWDNVHTKDKKEGRADIFKIAADRTLQLLQNTSGKKSADWKWGKIHTLTHKHPLSVVKPLDKLFNVGPLEVDGGSEVLNNLHFELDTTGYFPVTGGPALRKVTDFAHPELGETISPTGQSGNLMSPFYDDQAKMFATGKTRKMLLDRKSIESVSTYKLILHP